MGPVEILLRIATEDARDEMHVIARIGVNMEARQVVYGASACLNNGTAMGMYDIVHKNLLHDVLTEAICAAEALGL
jgi:hypothetical protein